MIRSVGFWRDNGLTNRVVFDDTLGERVNGGIDNLDWVSSPVPEPASALLLLSGLVAVRRRLSGRQPA